MEQFRVFGEMAPGCSRLLTQMIKLNEEKLGDNRFDLKKIEWITKQFVSISYYAMVDLNEFRAKKTL